MYEATPIRCFACQARTHTAREHSKDGDTAGLLITVSKAQDDE